MMSRRNYHLLIIVSLVSIPLFSGVLFGQRVIDLNKVWGDMRVLGRNVEDRCGIAVAHGDINGDGYMDIIIGACAADPGGRTGAGEVYAIFGFKNLCPSVDLRTQSADITICGSDAHDGSGFSVGSGDVNGDGYDDIIIGAFHADTPVGSLAGETYVIFGSISPPSTIDLSTSSADITVYGVDAYDESGYAVASGDINGDGFDDIIIGALYADPGWRNVAGETYVIFGFSPSSPVIIDLSTKLADIEVYGHDAEDYCGFAVASGDINGDSYDDIIIGAYQAEPTGRTNAGETYVIFGFSSSSPVTIDLGTSSADVTVYGSDSWDELGVAVGSGDVNGDGYDDLIIGATGADPPGGNEAGETYVIFGDDFTPPVYIDLRNQKADITVCGNDLSDQSGRKVTSGDINGDEYDDLIIGAYDTNAAQPGGYYIGETYVIFGSSNPLSVIDLNTQLSDITIYGDDDKDYFSLSLASGDVNGDGYDDLIIGAPYAETLGDPDAGETYVISGGGAIVTSHGVGGSGWVKSFSHLGRNWGKFQAFETETGEVQLAVGDIDGDGLEEIAAGHGEGGSSLVKLFEMDGSFIRSFLAFNATQNPGGEVHLAVGNFDADPSDKEIAAATGYNGGNRVRLFETDGTFISQFAAFGIGGNANGEVHIATADIDSDGIDEIICGHGEGGSSWVKLFEVDGSLIRSFRAFGAANANGEVHLAVGNFDADPSDIEIAVAHGEGGKSWVKLFNADGTFIRSFKAFGSANVQGEVHLAAADVEKGDSLWEIICGHGEGGSSWVRVFKAEGSLIRSFKAFGAANAQGEVHLAKSNY